jgi:tetratricopeptide (TPR) repeat protein
MLHLEARTAGAHLAALAIWCAAFAGYAGNALADMERDLSMCTAAEGRPSAAACIRVLNSGRLRDGDAYIAHFNMGDAHERAGDFGKALGDIERVIELRPGFARAYIARAMVQDDLGETAKALADLDEAIRLKGDSAGAYVARATMLRARGDFAGALADLKRAAEIEPKSSPVRLQRALALAENGDLDAAAPAVDDVFKAGKPDRGAFYVRAALYFAQDRLDAAEAELKRVLAERPTFAAARTLLGRVQEKRLDKTAARESYAAAIASLTGEFDRHFAKKLARERLAALEGSSGRADLGDDTKPASGSPAPAAVAVLKEAGEDAAPDAQIPAAREPQCKRFLPATGTIIAADCAE